jgi:hypothetical protein
MSKCWGSFILLATAMLVLGCGQEQDVQSTSPGDVASGDKYVLASEPQDARDVIHVRENAQDEQAVVVVGRIGGSANPWVEGKAAFSIVDLSLRACSDIEGDKCEKPWDYCCETDLLPKATVLVKVVDDSGNLVAVDARELLQAKELQTVVVQGKAKRDEAGNLTLLAGGIYLKP